MTVWPDPMGSAPWLIQVHAAAAVAALLVGAVVLVRRKGTASHRATGWLWVALMALASGTAVFIWEGGSLMIGPFGPFGPIHLLVVLTLSGLAQGIWHIRRGDVAAHRASMRMTFVASLLIAGGFTLLPGRRMARTLFGEGNDAAAWAALGALVALGAFLLRWWARADRRADRRAGAGRLTRR